MLNVIGCIVGVTIGIIVVIITCVNVSKIKNEKMSDNLCVIVGVAAFSCGFLIDYVVSRREYIIILVLILMIAWLFIAIFYTDKKKISKEEDKKGKNINEKSNKQKKTMDIIKNKCKEICKSAFKKEEFWVIKYIFIIITVLCWIGPIYLTFYVPEDCEKVEAKIVDIERKGSGKYAYNNIIVNYDYEGNEYNYIECDKYSIFFGIGDNVELYIHPKSPDEPYSTRGAAMLGIVVWCGVLLFTAFLVTFLDKIKNMIKKKK